MQSQRYAKNTNDLLMSHQKANNNNLASGSKTNFLTRYSFTQSLVLSIKKLEFCILPGHCVLCQLATNRNRDLCIYCENDLPWLSQQCARCGISGTAQTNEAAVNFSVTDTKLFSGISNKNPYKNQNCAICPHCNYPSHISGDSHAPFKHISHSFMPLSYKGCARWMVQQQKQSKGMVCGRVLAELMSDALTTRANHFGAPDWPELLVPVPLHWRRQLARGHNQSLVLANHLGKRLALPVSTVLAKRTVLTPSQQSLSKQARIKNVAGAFSATKQARAILSKLPNGRVAIVDDVVTTGSTAGALARVLVQAGAQEIHLWSPTRAILDA